jgi:spore maturation protein CgeB
MNGLKIVILGLSITSSWGNGHATTYRALVRELDARGHDVLFLERDVPWYREHRDLPDPPYGRTALYSSLEELQDRYVGELRRADLTIVGSYVPQGVAVGEWATASTGGLCAFYDIDTPVTLSKLARHDYEYLSPALIPRYHLYLSFTGGPTLSRLEHDFGAPAARPLYCSVDPAAYFPESWTEDWDLGYLGTYSDDRQPLVEQLLSEPARAWPDGRFIVAGSLYPEELRWPDNVMHVQHLAPSDHRRFYNSQRYTLNVTRAEMRAAGHSPSVRLFEAAACGTVIVSDEWPGLGDIFEVGREILVARSAEEMLTHLRTPEQERRRIAQRARARVLAEHTAARRVTQLCAYVRPLLERRRAVVGPLGWTQPPSRGVAP